MAGLELEFMVPPAEFQPFVSLFYRFRSVHDVDDLERAGLAQLRFRLSAGPSRYHFADGSEQETPRYHIIGPTSGPMRSCAQGPVSVFGMGLPPAGWAALMGSDASALVNRCVCAQALFGREVATTAVALRAAGDGAGMIAAITPWLRKRLHGGDDGTLTFVRAVDDWLTGAASPALEALEAATGLSRRQVERRCNSLYGAPPKLLARKVRALRAAVAMARGEEGEIEGFYDQSHLIREVKHFTGLTPRQMREEPGVLAQLTIQRRRALDGLVAPLVSRT